MQRLSFPQLPLVVKIAVALTFLNTWVNIEQLVIDHYGLWRYMPFYKVGGACVWDLLVGVTVIFFVWRASRAVERGAA